MVSCPVVGVDVPIRTESVEVALNILLSPIDHAALKALNLDQSEADNCPVLTAEAVGKFKTKALAEPFVEVEILKIVPDVPVETLFTIFTG